MQHSAKQDLNYMINAITLYGTPILCSDQFEQFMSTMSFNSYNDPMEVIKLFLFSQVVDKESRCFLCDLL